MLPNFIKCKRAICQSECQCRLQGITVPWSPASCWLRRRHRPRQMWRDNCTRARHSALCATKITRFKWTFSAGHYFCISAEQYGQLFICPWPQICGLEFDPRALWMQLKEASEVRIVLWEAIVHEHSPWKCWERTRECLGEFWTIATWLGTSTSL